MEFQNALQSMFSGMDQANKEDKALQELQGLFLGNQREMAMQPLDIQRKQYDNQVAQYNATEADAKRTSPTYIPWMLSGYEGQMKTQDAAGKKAQELLPMQVKSDKAELVNKELETSLLTKFRQLQQAGDLAGADSLMKQLMQTPKYAQDVGLEGVKSDNALALAGANNSAAMDRLEKELANRIETAKIKPHQGNPTFASEIIDNIKARREAGIITAAQATKELSDAYAASVRFDPNTSMALGQDAEGEPGLVPTQPRIRWNPTVAGGGVVTQQTVHNLQPQDKAALDWANKNPNDPRSAAIKKKLGVK